MTASVRLLPLLLVASTLTASPQTPAAPEAWRAGTATKLFAGASLEHWIAETVRPDGGTGNDKLPDVVDGAMRLTPRVGWTRTRDIHRDFRLEFAYRISDQGTGTTYFRTWPRLDKTGRPVRAFSFELTAADNEWHRATVDCRERSAYVTVDGKVIAFANDVTNSAGFVGFRAETGHVDIRDVVLTPFTDTSRALQGNRMTMDGSMELPRLVQEVKPRYTEDAMRERIQGGVWIEAEVLEDGTVGQILVVRSLDPVFGLDNEAVRAARAWRFQPATRAGKPVPVIVAIELTFTLK